MPQGEARDSEVLDRRRRRWKSRVSKRISAQREEGEEGVDWDHV